MSNHPGTIIPLHKGRRGVYQPRCGLMHEFRMVFDPYDPWGSTMLAFFDVAGELWHRGEEIPSEWGYRPGAVDDPRERDSFWFDILEDAKTETLRQFGAILNRYANVLDAAGRSY